MAAEGGNDEVAEATAVVQSLAKIGLLKHILNFVPQSGHTLCEGGARSLHEPFDFPVSVTFYNLVVQLAVSREFLKYFHTFSRSRHGYF